MKYTKSELLKVSHDTLNVLGRETEIKKCIEEMHELEFELNNILSGGVNAERVNEEIVDVEITLMHMKYLFGRVIMDYDYNAYFEEKIDRLKGIIKVAKDG